jgi:magnesium-transporting ATPase (P-type)
VSLGALFFVAGSLLGGLSFAAAFMFGIGIIVAIVPEGLLPTLTLSLAFGVRRMAERKALVKRLSAVETLGATTVILTDKTGTLTENEMTVRTLWHNGQFFKISGVGYEPVGLIEADGPVNDDVTPIAELLRPAALCCDARLVPPCGQNGRWTALGDPTEAAILTAAAKAGLSGQELAKYERLAELPFDSTRKRMTTIHRIDGSPAACVKGALNELLPRCTAIVRNGSSAVITPDDLKAVQAAHDELAGRGLRVLAVARRSLDPQGTAADKNWHAADIERELTLIGLIAMEDPPRPEVPSAIAACREASVRVVMITGDDGMTASAIGREIGLHRSAPRVITGDELEVLDEHALSALIRDEDILFARVAPEQKLKLVETFQHIGEVVAVTGDGVNDAPALKKADIGIAMGATGTDVAREAADMILTDDNFASIVAAIEEGRAVYDNIRKFVTYIFSSNSAEMMPFVVFILFQVPLPLTIMQVLAVDVGTDIFPALGLGAERPEPGVMQRRPRKRTARLLDLPTLLRAFAWLGMIEAVLSLSAFFFAEWLGGWRPGAPFIADGTVYVTATTVTFAGIVMAQVGNAFACRTSRQSVLKLGLFTNRLLLWGIAAEICLMMTLIYFPPAARMFNMSPLGARHWLMIAAFGVVLFLIEEARKFLVRRTRSKQPHPAALAAKELRV